MRLRALTGHPVEIEEQADHEISTQYHASNILEIVVAGVSRDALVLIQQVVNRELQLSILLFQELLGKAGIPKRNVLVEAGRPSGIDVIIDISR